MSIETAQRIKWRLEELPNKQFARKEFRKAIMYEAGCDERTIAHWIKVLKELGWTKRLNRHKWELAHND